MANSFVWVELATKDLKKSKNFYKGLFGWTLEETPGEDDYVMIDVGEGTGGGMMPKPDPGIPDHWLPYVLVDDVKASTEKAKDLGATIMKEVTAVSGMGWFSVIVDPNGAALGLWQSKESM